MPDIESTIRNEQTILRAELRQLKRCQLQYFLLSLATIAAVFGFNGAFAKSSDFGSMVSLAPLLIILPCWWTFFDKATTITRLIGYTRVFIENQLSQRKKVFIGYENALAIFRQEEDQDARSKIEIPWRVLKVRTRHRYWMINWYTFFFLSVLCCLMPLLVGGVNPNPYFDARACFVYLLAIAVLFSTLYTFRIVCHLTTGKYSFNRVTEYWRVRVLEKHVQPRS